MNNITDKTDPTDDPRNTPQQDEDKQRRSTLADAELVQLSGSQGSILRQRPHVLDDWVG